MLYANIKEKRYTFTFMKHIKTPIRLINVRHNTFNMYKKIKKNRVYRTFNPTWKLLPKSKIFVLELPNIRYQSLALKERYSYF